MANLDAFEQLVAARPEITSQTAVVMDAEMRSTLRTSIIESRTAPLTRRQSPTSGRRRAGFATAGLAVCVSLVAIVIGVVPSPPQSAAAAILAKTERAFEAPGVGVVVAHQVENGPKGSSSIESTVWQDPRDRNRFRNEISSPPMSEVGGFVKGGKAEIISVNFENRSAFIMPAGSRPSSVPYAPTEARLQAAQRAGTLKVVGHQVVDGVETVHLSGSVKQAQTELWIDPVDYHLVRIEDRFNGYHIIADVKWLSPTPANLALLNVTVPSGFTITQLPSRTVP
jgi:hypothetical protein